MCSPQLTWVIGCISAFILTLILNYISTTGAVFTDQATLSDKYSLEITPPGWAFSIWGIIYIWQALWLLYMLFNAIKFRDTLSSSSILTFGKVFFISWICSCIFNGSWILLFASEQLVLSCIVLFAISIALYVNLYSSHKYIGLAAIYNPDSNNDSSDQLFPSYILNTTTITLYRILVLNGVAFYAAWTSIAQFLNVAIVLTYVGDVYSNTSCLIALGLFTAVLLVYWFLDLYYLRTWLLYTYAPYATLLWALSAISTNPSEGDMALKGATRAMVYVLIALTAAVLVLKIVLAIFCKPQLKKQINTSHVEQYSGVDTEYNAMEEL